MTRDAHGNVYRMRTDLLLFPRLRQICRKHDGSCPWILNQPPLRLADAVHHYDLVGRVRYVKPEDAIRFLTGNRMPPKKIDATSHRVAWWANSTPPNASRILTRRADDLYKAGPATGPCGELLHTKRPQGSRRDRRRPRTTG